MTDLFFPQALNQGQAATLTDVLRYIAIVGGGCAILGMFGYSLTWLCFRLILATPRPFRFVNKASLTVGFAFAALIPLYLVPNFFCGPSNLAAIVGIALGAMALVIAMGTALRLALDARR